MSDEGMYVVTGFVIGIFVTVVLVLIILPEASQRQALEICSAAGYDRNVSIDNQFYCASGGDGADIVHVESLIELLKEHKEIRDE